MGYEVLGPVHTYPDIFESATYFLSGFAFRPHVSSEFACESAIFFNLLSRAEIFESVNNLEPCGRVNPDIFESDDVVKSGLVFIDTNKSIAT